MFLQVENKYKEKSTPSRESNERVPYLQQKRMTVNKNSVHPTPKPVNCIAITESKLSRGCCPLTHCTVLVALGSWYRFPLSETHDLMVETVLICSWEWIPMTCTSTQPVQTWSRFDSFSMPRRMYRFSRTQTMHSCTTAFWTYCTR